MLAGKIRISLLDSGVIFSEAKALNVFSWPFDRSREVQMYTSRGEIPSKSFGINMKH